MKPVLAAAVLASAGSAYARPPSPPPSAEQSSPAVTQWRIRETIIMRIPVRPDATPLRWQEKDDRKCMNVRSIAMASLASSESLDLTLKNGERWRMKFRGECPAVGFYRGFYLRPNEDGKVCARRDTIHLRSGGECEIRNFRRLKPVRD